MIDREKVIRGLECCSAMSGDECRKCPYEHECRDTDLHYGIPHLAADAIALLKEQETVVRCKDCKHWRQNTEFCGRWSVGNIAQHTPPDWYCADGERR